MINCYRRAVVAVGMAGFLSLSGCVGYRLGSMLPADIQSVYVETFHNRTDEPLIEVDATRATIAELQRDGSLKVLRSPEGAEAVLQVTLVGCQLSPIAFQPGRATAAEEYKLTLQATALLTRSRNGAVVVELPRVKGETTFVLDSDLTSAKQAALPAAARDLGRHIVAGLVEAWP